MNITQILNSANDGDSEARANLIQAAYEDLRKLAAGRMAGERQNHTLTATALVNEVSLKLLNESHVPMENRRQFFGYASKAMRNLLIDHARTRGRQKRGGKNEQFSFEEAMVACDEQRDDFLAINEALEELAKMDERKAQVVEMKYFGGLNNHEIADILEISITTVKRDWETARAWLLIQLGDGSEEEP